MNAKSGFVYVMTNPSFKDDWVKIGYSTGNPAKRAKDLDNTAVPLPFEIFASLQTERCKAAEKLIHRFVRRLNEGLRIRENREFFNIKPEVAAEILEDVSGLLGDDAKVVYWKNGKQITEISVITKSKPQTEHEPRYSESVLLRGKPLKIKKLYAELKNGILRLDDKIVVNPQKLYVSFKHGKKCLCSVEVQNKLLRVCIAAKKGMLKNPSGVATDISQKGHWGTGDYRVDLFDSEHLRNTLDLISQTISPVTPEKSATKCEPECRTNDAEKISDIKDITGKKIEYVVFKGHKEVFNNLRNAFVTIVAKMVEFAPDKFLGTETGEWLGLFPSSNGLRQAAKITDGWYIETNNSSNRKIILLREVCRVLGMEDELALKFA